MADVSYSVQDRIARIHLNAPSRGNTITLDTRRELNQALLQYKADSDAWVAVISAEGKDFCLGSDGSQPSSYRERRDRFSLWGGGFVEVWKPTIAAIQGQCRGEGLALALGCDLRLADDTATFAADYTGGPAEPDVLAAWLVALVGLSTTFELLWLGRTLGASEAQQRGLVNRLTIKGPFEQQGPPEGRFPMVPMKSTVTVPNGDAQTAGITFAEELLQYAPMTRTFQKETAYRSIGLPFHYAQTLLLGPDPYSSRDRIEGNTAFAENRRPVWQNR